MPALWKSATYSSRNQWCTIKADRYYTVVVVHSSQTDYFSSGSLYAPGMKRLFFPTGKNGLIEIFVQVYRRRLSPITMLVCLPFACLLFGPVVYHIQTTCSSPSFTRWESRGPLGGSLTVGCRHTGHWRASRRRRNLS